jgi:hypothetical protein
MNPVLRLTSFHETGGDGVLVVGIRDRVQKEAVVSSTSEEETLGAQVAAHEPKMWRWHIEPGKEETFEYLRGWLLGGQQEASVEYVRPADQVHETSADPPDVRWPRWWLATAGRASLVRGSARLAARALLRAGGRLLQWAGEGDHIETSGVERQERT